MFWNQTAQFAGTSTSYLAVANNADINLTGDFTMEAWVFPTSVSGTEKGLFAKGPSLGASLRYAVKISTTGRITISTNGILRLTSTVAIAVNTWTHVSATYNATTNTFAIYLNGALNTSAVVAAASPPSNTDSLYIGVAGGGLPFAGQLDEVRLWKRALSATEVSQFFRTTIGTASGVNYFSLVLSYPFQKNNPGGTVFSLVDWTGNGNTAKARNVTPVNIGNTQYVTISPVECLFFQGSGEYVSGASNALVSPSTVMTIEAWVYPRSYLGTPSIVSKNSATSYKIGINTTGKLQYFPKGGAAVLDGKGVIPQQRWSHVTAQYDGVTTSLYINGVLDTSTTSITGPIGVNTDSLFIGCDVTGGIATKFFNGWIDEVRICNYMKTQQQIQDFMFRSIDSTNQPNPAMTNVSYNFDGLLSDNGDGGPRLYFGDSARFSEIGGVANQPIGPMLRDDANNFIGSYIIKSSFKRVPLTGGTGTTDDSIDIPFNININDINVFVAINHTDETNLDVSLIAPNGESVVLSNDGITAGAYDHLITIFDEQAVNSVNTTSYTTFSPRIRPEGSFISTFGGDQTQGVWRLRVTDDGGAADTGRIYAWGIQFNNSTEPDRVTTLDLTSIIQGFWDGSTMVQDTMRVYLRNTFAPYTITDSAKVFLSTAGTATMSFINTGNATKYISLKHRNSVDTWSSAGVVFKLDSTITYNFSTASSKAYGNNQILKSGKYCIYSGDVNKDAAVNLTDLLAIFNDNINFAVGYIKTDVNGDNFINLDDILLTANNSSNFVVSVTPP
ncbi:MAG: LamG-like jellyroll fold domain-containing protein [Ignavibacteria bacterium]